MKGLKKLLTGILTATMLLSMGLPVSATEPTTVRGDNTTPYTITINNPAMDHTYTAYQIFKGTLDTTKDSHNKVLSQILSDIEWGSGVDTTTSSNEIADDVAKKIKTDNIGVILYSPLPAPIDKIKNKYRWRMIIKCKFGEDIVKFINGMLEEYNKYKKNNTKISIALNPSNMS